MNKEELLFPRFKVIANYPNSNFAIGKIIILNEFGAGKYWHKYTEEEPIHIEEDEIGFPQIFEKLNWWDDRKVEDMPIYIKSQTQVVKPNWKEEEWNGRKYLRAYDTESAKYNLSVSFKLECFEPATEEEFNSIIKSLEGGQKKIKTNCL